MVDGDSFLCVNILSKRQTCLVGRHASCGSQRPGTAKQVRFTGKMRGLRWPRLAFFLLGPLLVKEM